MKKIIATILICCATQIIIAQQQVSISDTPTNEELRTAFISDSPGTADPFIIIPAIVKKGNKAIPALQDLLFATVGKDQKQEEVQRTALYAAMALDGIGTKEAYDALLKALSINTDPEVRGQVIKAIAQSYYQKSHEGIVSPDKEVLHILLLNVDDTTRTKYQHGSIAQIAREGIKNWLDQDLGDPILGTQSIEVSDYTPKIPCIADRENWWQDNNKKIEWNKELGRFEIKKAE